MGKMGAFVLLIILSMDIVAGVLGIQAEIAKNNVRHMKLQGNLEYCKEASGITRLGLAALFLFIVAHIAANLFSACMCLSSIEEWENLSSAYRKIWFAWFIQSWIIAAIGFSVLIIGMLQNSRSEGSCKILEYHFLLIGGISCFMHGLVCVAMYITVTLCFGNPNSTTSEHQRRP